MCYPVLQLRAYILDLSIRRNVAASPIVLRLLSAIWEHIISCEVRFGRKIASPVRYSYFEIFGIAEEITKCNGWESNAGAPHDEDTIANIAGLAGLLTFNASTVRWP